MKKSMIIAGALAWSCAVAVSVEADTGLVDIQFTVDHTQPTEMIYESVLEKAEDTCGRDNFCEQELVEALVEAIDSEALTEVHMSAVDVKQPILIAAAD